MTLSASKTASYVRSSVSAVTTCGANVASPCGLTICKPPSRSFAARPGLTRNVTSCPARASRPPKYPPVEPAPTTSKRILLSVYAEVCRSAGVRRSVSLQARCWRPISLSPRRSGSAAGDLLSWRRELRVELLRGLGEFAVPRSAHQRGRLVIGEPCRATRLVVRDHQAHRHIQTGAQVVAKHGQCDQRITDGVRSHLRWLPEEREPGTMIDGQKPGKAAGTEGPGLVARKKRFSLPTAASTSCGLN